MTSGYDDFATHFNQQLRSVIRRIDEVLAHSYQKDNYRHATRCAVLGCVDNNIQPRALCTSLTLKPNQQFAAPVEGMMPVPLPVVHLSNATHSKPMNQQDGHIGQFTRSCNSQPNRIAPVPFQSATNAETVPPPLDPPPVYCNGTTATVGDLASSLVKSEEPRPSLAHECSLSSLTSDFQSEDGEIVPERCSLQKIQKRRIISPGIDTPDLCSHSDDCSPFYSSAVDSLVKSGVMVSGISCSGGPSSLLYLCLSEDRRVLRVYAPEAMKNKKSVDSTGEVPSHNSRISVVPSTTDSNWHGQQKLRNGYEDTGSTAVCNGVTVRRFLLPHGLLLYPYGVIGFKSSGNVGGVSCGAVARRLLVEHSCTVFVGDGGTPYRAFLLLHCLSSGSDSDGSGHNCACNLSSRTLLGLQFRDRLEWAKFMTMAASGQSDAAKSSASLSYGRLLWMLAAHAWQEGGRNRLTSNPRTERAVEAQPGNSCESLPKPLPQPQTRQRVDLATEPSPVVNPVHAKGRVAGVSNRFSIRPSCSNISVHSFSSDSCAPTDEFDVGKKKRRFGVPTRP
ncbi:hypothetical protein ERJ75_000941000 [Trypanosoma vivax]|nr:hypothetical protein TRVL_03830 [Trypanosoma vivax]KAH8611185.1 hypothetical protein ERJ75_000941000 [Trypanosoma vivax]